jgi:hypothetical protein
MRRPLVGLGMGIGARLRPAAAQGGVVSPEHGVRPREGATDCTNTPKGSAGGGYSHRGSNSGDGVAQGVGGVNLAAELDGAWRRGRRGAWSRGSGLGGVRGLRAELSRRLAVVGASGSAGNRGGGAPALTPGVRRRDSVRLLGLGRRRDGRRGAGMRGQLKGAGGDPGDAHRGGRGAISGEKNGFRWRSGEGEVTRLPGGAGVPARGG